MKKPVKRRYFGEATGKALAAFLNDHDPRTADARRVVGRLISIGQRCDASRDPSVRELLKRSANNILHDLAFNPVIVSIHGTWTVHWEAHGEYNSSEDAVRLWLELVGLGLHSRLRRCARKKCRRWYYARFDHASFHSIKCRGAAAKEDPVRRQRRKKYERDYYYQHREKAAPKGAWS